MRRDDRGSILAPERIRAGAEFYATNADATYPMPDGLYPGGGAIVAFLERSTDVAAIVCGKPHAPTRAMVRTLAGDGGVLVVGDRAETDKIGKTRTIVKIGTM